MELTEQSESELDKTLGTRFKQGKNTSLPNYVQGVETVLVCVFCVRKLQLAAVPFRSRAGWHILWGWKGYGMCM